MDESAISVRYAKAIFSLANEKDFLADLKNDMDLIADVCNHSVEFNLLLKSPVVATSKKISIIRQIFKGKIHEITMNFLELVTRKKREIYIPSMSRNTLALIRKEKNIKTAVLTTAKPLDEKLLQKAKKIFEDELKTEVELSARESPHIIGGLILRIDDKQYDASIATQLKKIKQEMMKS
jgi:F-type H+-transporting ATPase subunit delta